MQENMQGLTLFKTTREVPITEKFIKIDDIFSLYRLNMMPSENQTEVPYYLDFVTYFNTKMDESVVIYAAFIDNIIIGMDACELKGGCFNNEGNFISNKIKY